MYDWRKMSDEERAEVLRIRKGRGLPWHSPPHLEYVGFVTFIITAACFEHVPLIGKSVGRMTECEKDILEICQSFKAEIFAWCILPNHYHVLLKTEKIKTLRKQIGLFHGRASFE